MNIARYEAIGMSLWRGVHGVMRDYSLSTFSNILQCSSSPRTFRAMTFRDYCTIFVSWGAGKRLGEQKYKVIL